MLKLLVSKEVAELSRTIAVNQNEIKQEYDLIVREEGESVKPFNEMAPEIKQDIYNRKMQAAFNKWLASLRRESIVKVNKKVLNEIEID